MILRYEANLRLFPFVVSAWGDLGQKARQAECLPHPASRGFCETNPIWAKFAQAFAPWGTRAARKNKPNRLSSAEWKGTSLKIRTQWVAQETRPAFPENVRLSFQATVGRRFERLAARKNRLIRN
jgi:hypothetical protein